MEDGLTATIDFGKIASIGAAGHQVVLEDVAVGLTVVDDQDIQILPGGEHREGPLGLAVLEGTDRRVVDFDQRDRDNRLRRVDNHWCGLVVEVHHQQTGAPCGSNSDPYQDNLYSFHVLATPTILNAINSRQS